MVENALRRAAPALLAALATVAAVPAAAETASSWLNGYNSRSRLIAGASEPARPVAGLEIELAKGWKTYWRSPGDAGGVPPHFDFEGSENLMSATVLYPAPKRLADAAGDAVGYKDRVIFPIRLVPKDPGQSVRLKVHFEFGICREICVPAEAEHELMIPATTTGVPAGITTALTGVPARAGAGSDAGLPSLASAEAKLSGEKPVLRLAARFPRGLAGADAFVEAPDGIYLPLPQRVGDDGKTLARFEIDLSGGADADELKGKLLTITLVSDAGATEAAWIVP